MNSTGNNFCVEMQIQRNAMDPNRITEINIVTNTNSNSNVNPNSVNDTQVNINPPPLVITEISDTNTAQYVKVSIPRMSMFMRCFEGILYLISFGFSIWSIVVGKSNDDDKLTFMAAGHLAILLIIIIANLTQRFGPGDPFYAFGGLLFLCMIIFMMAMPAFTLMYAKSQGDVCSELHCILRQFYAIYYIVLSILSLCSMTIMSTCCKEGKNIIIDYWCIIACFIKE